MRKKQFKTLFMGTPAFGIPTLNALLKSEDFDVDLVITQPDRPQGRKLKLTACPIKLEAEKNGIEVITPEKVSHPEMIEKIKQRDFDVVVVLAFGQILKQNLLDIFPHKFINIHASLLPRWRGAAPIQRSIMEGDKETGISLQVMELTLDTGPLIFEERTSIQPNENSFELAERLSQLSAESVCGALKKYLEGEVTPRPQNESEATYAKKITKQEGLIDWKTPAPFLHNKVRGLKWGPGAFTYYNKKRVKVDQTYLPPESEVSELSLESGQVALSPQKGALYIGTVEGVLGVKSLQPEGSKPLKVADFTNGYSLTGGEFFEDSPS